VCATRSHGRWRVTVFLRERARNREDAIGDLPETVEELPVFEGGGTTRAFTLPELLRAVDALEPNPPVPQVFRERFFEGRATDEIAKARGINRNTLVSYYARGLKSLRTQLIQMERLLQ
jgi:DNA-directed RNA polymerase specialized sigma24 family protein